MRTWTGRALVGLGAFLLVIGVLSLTWATGAVKKTPLEVDTTTILTGTAAKLDSSTNQLVENPVYLISRTYTDTDISDDDTNAWLSTTCIMVDRGQDPKVCVDGSDDMVTASASVFASDRVTAMADLGDLDMPADAEVREGLANKWPFDAEQVTYDYWESTLGQAVDAEFDRVEELDGLETYVYLVEVDGTAEVVEGVPGRYVSVKELFVEPATGAIVNQTEDQQRYLEDGTQILDMQLAFSDDQLVTSVDDAKSNKLMINAVDTYVPIGGIVGGIVLLLAGLLLGSRSTGAGRRAGRTEERELAGV